MNYPIAAAVKRVTQISRWREYGTTKAPLFFTATAYVLLKFPQPVLAAYAIFISVTLFGALYLAFGYMINDYADRDVDRWAGKSNFLGSIGRPQAQMLLAAVFACAILTALPLIQSPLAAGATLIAFLVSFAYSLPPLHLKVRGIWGVFAGAVAQRVLPIMVLFAAFRTGDAADWLFLALYSLIGIRWMLIHQIIDQRNDQRTGVTTFVTVRGESVASYLLSRLFFPTEIAVSLALIVVMAQVSSAALLLAIAILLELLARFLLHRLGRVRFSLATYSDIPLACSYLWLWPIGLTLMLAVDQPALAGLVVLVFLWQWPFLTGECVRFARLVAVLGMRQRP